MVPTQVASLLPPLVGTIDRPPWTGIELLDSAAVSFVVTAVGVALVGAVVSAVAPDFTDNGVGYLRAEPGEAFVYGVAAYVAIAVAMFVLAITIIGLIVVVPAIVVLAVLSFGGTAVSVIALGTWIRSAVGRAPTDGRGADLLVGAIAWAGLGVIPILGGLVRFVVGAMGFGYLALWIANGQFDRGYGSVTAGGHGGTGGRGEGGGVGETGGTVRSTRGPDARDGGTAADIPEDADSDRFRNIAALDAEREAEERERARKNDTTGADDAADDSDSTGRGR